MNDRFFVSVCARTIEKDGSRKHYLGRLIAKDIIQEGEMQMFITWRVKQVKGTVFKDSLSRASLIKYSIQSFANKDWIKRFKKDLSARLRKMGITGTKPFNIAFAMYLTKLGYEYGQIDLAFEIIGEVK